MAIIRPDVKPGDIYKININKYGYPMDCSCDDPTIKSYFRSYNEKTGEDDYFAFKYVALFDYNVLYERYQFRIFDNPPEIDVEKELAKQKKEFLGVIKELGKDYTREEKIEMVNRVVENMKGDAFAYNLCLECYDEMIAL